MFFHNLSYIIPPPNPLFPMKMVDEGKHLYTLRPHEVGRYEVKATFNGDPISGKFCFLSLKLFKAW